MAKHLVFISSSTHKRLRQQEKAGPTTVDEYWNQSARFWYGIVCVLQKPVHAEISVQDSMTTSTLGVCVSGQSWVQEHASERTWSGMAHPARPACRRTRRCSSAASMSCHPTSDERRSAQPSLSSKHLFASLWAGTYVRREARLARRARARVLRAEAGEDVVHRDVVRGVAREHEHAALLVEHVGERSARPARRVGLALAVELGAGVDGVGRRRGARGRNAGLRGCTHHEFAMRGARAMNAYPLS
jgi:hypothetical protein